MSSSTPVTDFVVATSDRRRELRGARWDSLRQGASTGAPLVPVMDRTRPQPRFEKGVTFATHQAVAHFLPPVAAAGNAARRGQHDEPDAATRLALLLQHAAWPLRWEPLNGCGQHRAVATPGALFPVDLYLRAQTCNGPRVLYCSPRDLCLLETAAAHETVDGLEWIIAGNLGRCVGIYGDLALWLVALEAGMLQAQLQLVARALGWQLAFASDHDYAALRGLAGLTHWSEVPLLRGRLSGDGAATAAAQLRCMALATLRALPHHAAAEHHPLMRRFLEHSPAQAAAAEPRSPHATPDDAGENDTRAFPLLDVSARRSSGLGSGVARWTRDLPDALLQALLADTQQLLRDNGCADPAAAPLVVSLYWRPTQSASAALFDLDPVQARLTPLAPSAQALAAARSMCRYNDALLLTIGTDGNLASEQAGGRPLIDAHLRAGVLAQCLSLAAVRSGLTARLFMAYSDAQKNLLLPLDKRTLVQILIGFDPRANPAFAIT